MQKEPTIQDDLRVQRTKKWLQQALFELTIEKGFATITVRDISDRAQVNRSTFYRHYLDKYDLLNQYLDDLQAQASEAASLADAHQPMPNKVPAGLLIIIKHIQQYADFYRIMLGKNGDQQFTHRFRQLTENRYRHLFANSEKNMSQDPPNEMRMDYIAHATVGAILWWLENGQPCTPEQLALWLGGLNLTSAGLK